jgi:hypothetical protein
LGSTLAGSGAEVMIHDLSVTGLLIETSQDLIGGEVLQVEIPGHGPTLAKVIWQSDNFFGCAFENGIPASAVSAALLRSPAILSDDRATSLGRGVAASLAGDKRGHGAAVVPATPPPTPAGRLHRAARGLRKQLGFVRRTSNFLYVQRVKGFPLPSAPGLDAASLQRFRAELSAAEVYLEFGSGGTTLLADRLGVETVTVESDRYFAKAMKAALRGTNVTILTPNIGITERWGRPIFNKPTARRLKRWRSYVDEPFACLRAFPDLVLVDGRFRVACALESARQAYLRGCTATLIVDDYAARPRYRVVEQWLGKPEMAGRAAVFEIGSRAVPEVVCDDPS